MHHAATVGYQGFTMDVSCPYCEAITYRVRRQLPDRVVSLYRPVRRYRCMACGWEGLRWGPEPARIRLPEKWQRALPRWAPAAVVGLALVVLLWSSLRDVHEEVLTAPPDAPAIPRTSGVEPDVAAPVESDAAQGIPRIVVPALDFAPRDTTGSAAPLRDDGEVPGR